MRTHRSFFTFLFLFFCSFAIAQTEPSAQTNVEPRLLSGYELKKEIVVRGKPALYVLTDQDALDNVFTGPSGKSRAGAVNFSKETVIGIATLPTVLPTRLAISRVYTQNDQLTVRYTRQTSPEKQDTTRRPVLLLAIPKQHVTSVRLVENGKLLQTLRLKSETAE